MLVSFNNIRKYYYYLLIINYWVLSFFTWTDKNIEQFSAQYFFTVIPIWIFIIINIDRIFVIRKYKILLIYLVLVLVVSIFRIDIKAVYNSILLIGTVYVLLNSGYHINLKFINILFILSIIGGFLTYLYGNNYFHLLPYQSVHLENEWRVSFFPKIPATGLFSFFVLIYNIFYNKSVYKYIFIFLSLYFIVFSGTRTVIIVLVYCIPFITNRKFCRNLNNYIVIVLSTFVLLLYSPKLLMKLRTNNPIINNIIYKEQANDKNLDVNKTIYRTKLWTYHFDILKLSPIIGVGSYELKDYIDNKNLTGSESFFTRLFSQFGLIFLFFILFLISLIRNLKKENNRFKYCVLLLFLISGLAYGSYLVPYSFIFILLFSSFNVSKITE